MERWSRDRKAKNKPVTSEKKAGMFDRSVAKKLLARSAKMPDRKELRKIRTKIWKKKNPGKVAREIKEATYPLTVEDLEF